MPTIREIFERVRKTDDNKAEPDYEHLAAELGINDYLNFWENKEFKRLAAYWLAPTYCTDQWVGQRVYFLDDEPIALSTQRARKCQEEFFFVSQEKAEKVRRFFYEILMEENKRPVSTVSLDSIIPDAFSVEYPDQFVDRTGTYKGQPCEVVRVQNIPGAYVGGHVCDIVLNDGTEKTVRCADIKIPLRID